MVFITRQEFAEFIEAELQNIKDLFARKNKSYGVADDVFHNFRLTAERVYGEANYATMFSVAFTYMDKHQVALANRGVNDPEAMERLSDNIVYSLLMKAMVHEYGKSMDGMVRDFNEKGGGTNEG